MSVLKKAREKFFNDCDYVVRAPGSFYWTGEYSVEFGHPAILQTINNYVYVGLKLNSEKTKVIINRIKRSAPSYSIDKIDPQTHYVNYDKHAGELKQYIDVLKTKLNDWLVMHRIQSKFELKIWSDVPFSVGLNSNSAICGCLGMILYALEEKLNPNELKKQLLGYMDLEIGDLKKNNCFNRIFQLARWCIDLFDNRYKSGASVFASLLPSRENRELILYYTEKRGYNSSINIFRNDENYTHHLEVISRLKYFGSRIEVPIWLRDSHALSLIYCGEENVSKSLLADMQTWHRLESKRIASFLNKTFLKSSLKDISFPEPMVSIVRQEDINIEPDSYPEYIYNCALGMVSWRILDLLIDKHPRPNDLKELIIENHKLLKAFGILRGPLRSFKRELNAKMSRNLRYQIWSKMTGPGNGGNIIVFGELMDIRAVNKLITKPENESDHLGEQLHFSTTLAGWSNVKQVSPVCYLDSSANDSKIKLVRTAGGEILFKWGKGKNETSVSITRVEYICFLTMLVKAIGNDFRGIVPRWLIYKGCYNNKKGNLIETDFTPPLDNPATMKEADKKATTFFATFKAAMKRKGIPIDSFIDKETIAHASSDSYLALSKGWRLNKDKIGIRGFDGDITIKGLKSSNSKLIDNLPDKSSPALEKYYAGKKK